jgi:hypothetical protein
MHAHTHTHMYLHTTQKIQRSLKAHLFQTSWLVFCSTQLGILGRQEETPPIVPGPWWVFVILCEQQQLIQLQQQVMPSSFEALVWVLGAGTLALQPQVLSLVSGSEALSTSHTSSIGMAKCYGSCTPGFRTGVPDSFSNRKCSSSLSPLLLCHYHHCQPQLATSVSSTHTIAAGPD